MTSEITRQARDDSATATAMKSLESDLCDTISMICLTADLSDQFLENLAVAQRAGHSADLVATEYDVQQFSFAYNHAVQLANNLKERFFAALEGKVAL